MEYQETVRAVSDKIVSDIYKLRGTRVYVLEFYFITGGRKTEESASGWLHGARIKVTTHWIVACKDCRKKFRIFRIFNKNLLKLFIVLTVLFFLLPLFFGVFNPVGILFIILGIVSYIFQKAYFLNFSYSTLKISFRDLYHFSSISGLSISF